MTLVVSASRMPTTHATLAGRPADDLLALLPPGWTLDVPLVRVYTCGTLAVEVLQDLHLDQSGHMQAVYALPAAELFHIKGTTTALLLLALLASQSGCFAAKDFLTQTLPHLRRVNAFTEEDDLEDDASLSRLDNVVSLLRKLLCPPRLLALPEAHTLRKRLVQFVRATPESGPGYRLAAFPLLWLDVETMERSVAQARQLEEQGEDGLESWQAAYQIGMRGPFLGHEPYSEWADWRRGRVAGLLWQSVNAQGQRAASWQEGTSGSCSNSGRPTSPMKMHFARSSNCWASRNAFSRPRNATGSSAQHSSERGVRPIHARGMRWTGYARHNYPARQHSPPLHLVHPYRKGWRLTATRCLRSARSTRPATSSGGRRGWRACAAWCKGSRQRS